MSVDSSSWIAKRPNGAVLICSTTWLLKSQDKFLIRLWIVFLERETAASFFLHLFPAPRQLFSERKIRCLSQFVVFLTKFTRRIQSHLFQCFIMPFEKASVLIFGLRMHIFWVLLELHWSHWVVEEYFITKYTLWLFFPAYYDWCQTKLHIWLIIFSFFGTHVT